MHFEVFVHYAHFRCLSHRRAAQDVVAVAMGDDRTVDRARRVDEKPARLAIEPPFWPTIIDSVGCSQPTFSAPEPRLLILGSQ